MSANYRESLETARLGVEMVLPLVRTWLPAGVEPIATDAALDAEWWQRTLGDYLLPLRGGKLAAVEVKAERRHTGNLFVEVYSNRDRGRGRDGWLFTSHADALLMAFLDVRAVYVVPLARFWAWCEVFDNLRRYPSRPARCDQPNRTVGRLVPFVDFLAAVGGSVWREGVGGRWCRIDVRKVAEPVLRVV